MLFNSLAFSVFLPIVFILYWGVFGYLMRNCKQQVRWQNLFIIIASYVFYGWWDWRFLLLIAFTSFCSWGSGLLIGKYVSSGQLENENKKAKLWLTLNIILNLGILTVFKYYDLFVSEIGQLFGINTDILLLRLILPVGISFYTFQALSYSIDVYRGKIEPTKDIIAFFAFIGFFPQLVAGPIERATNLLPQFLRKRQFSFDAAADGMRLLLWGLFKKVVIADACAQYVDTVFADISAYNGSSLLLAAFLFTIQIYADFSGYSDMAIGIAQLFGIQLTRNFNNPYFSRNINDFWHRWHISLTSWFRDYVYIPLGGSRNKNQWRTYLNILIVFSLSGLWHGANWTFIFWGLYHGLLLVIYKILNDKHKLPSMAILTFLLVMLGWIIFRVENIGEVSVYLAHLYSSSLFERPFIISPTYIVQLPLTLTLCFLTEFVHRHRRHGLDITYLPLWLRWTVYIVLLVCIFLFGEQAETFIYFQF